MVDGTSIIATAILASNGLFWSGVFRYYYGISFELSQYAQGPIRSPICRAALISLNGFLLAVIFVFSCILQSSYLSNFVTENGFTFPLLILILLSAFSPVFNYISICIFAIFPCCSLSTFNSFGVALGGAFIFFGPSSYILYETRKELEQRFQAAVGSPPRRLFSSFRLRGFSHGNATICGVLGAIRGIFLFPTYLYYDLLKARQGTIVYQKVSHDEHVTRVQEIKFDVGQQIAAIDEASMNESAVRLCPRCKKPLVFLEDQQKWWCNKCKRASYTC